LYRLILNTEWFLHDDHELCVLFWRAGALANIRSRKPLAKVALSWGKSSLAIVGAGARFIVGLQKMSSQHQKA
jgi:hypothetical protein